MNDSAVFNPDAWRNFFTRLLGLHQTRKVEFKEVIIHDITVQEASAQLGELSLMAEEFKQSRLRRPQLFLSFWWKGVDNRFVAPISAKIDAVCDYMSDCRDKVVVGKLLDFPVIMPQWIYHPSHKKWLSALAMLLFPVSIPIWILGYIKQRRLCEDISATIATCKAVDDLLRERLGDAPIS
jgi:lipopolysaccharide export system permease protein